MMLTSIKEHFLVIPVLSCLLSSCDKNQEAPKEYPTIVHAYYYNSTERYSDATVSLYESEEDFLFGENPVAVGVTPEDIGQQFWHYDKESKPYWYRVELGELNNMREYLLTQESGDSYFEYRYKTQRRENSPGYVTYEGETLLSRTPARLQITVVDNSLNPVENAAVQLYFSEDDFENDVPAYLNEKELEISYEISHLAILPEVFSGVTDSEGVIVFDFLEPRHYWFKITRHEMTNNNTTFKTTEPLPDNWNVTNSMTVVIQ